MAVQCLEASSLATPRDRTAPISESSDARHLWQLPCASMVQRPNQHGSFQQAPQSVYTFQTRISVIRAGSYPVFMQARRYRRIAFQRPSVRSTLLFKPYVLIPHNLGYTWPSPPFLGFTNSALYSTRPRLWTHNMSSSRYMPACVLSNSTTDPTLTH